jgi:hypothetical protein
MKPELEPAADGRIDHLVYELSLKGMIYGWVKIPASKRDVNLLVLRIKQ